MNKLLAWGLTSLTLCALAGCGSGPSDADVEKAVKGTVEKARADLTAQAPGAGGLYPEIHTVKNLGCKSASDAVYACDVELDATQAGRRSKNVTSVRLAKGSDGWTVAR